MTNQSILRLRWLALTLATAIMITGCGLMAREDPRVEATGGNIERGNDLARTNGCIACHSVPGVASVQNGYGPDLHGFGANRLIAGGVENEPGILIAFLLDPQAMVPGTSMPNVGLSEDEARDIASWLYSLDD